MIVPRPGWVLIERVGTEESFAGSQLIIPTQARDRMSRWQYAVVQQGGEVLPDPEKPTTKHPGTRTQFAAGDWIITPPRRAVELDESTLLVQEADIWARVS